VARAILAHVDFLDANIAALDEEVAARLGPFRAAVELLKTIPGVGQTAAEVFVAETGGDMSRFPSASHPAAWAGLAPAQRRVGRQAPPRRHPQRGEMVTQGLHRVSQVRLPQPRGTYPAAREAKRLVARLEALGHKVTLNAA
jgi:transposase